MVGDVTGLADGLDVTSKAVRNSRVDGSRRGVCGPSLNGGSDCLDFSGAGGRRGRDAECIRKGNLLHTCCHPAPASSPGQWRILACYSLTQL